MSFSKKGKSILFTLSSALLITYQSEAKDFYVENSSQLTEILIEAAVNGEDDVIYFKSGVYDISLDLVYKPLPSEHYSLTFRPVEGNKLVLLKRETDNHILKADFSNVEGNAKLIFEDISFLDITQDFEKKNPILEIIGKNLDIKLKNCNFIGNFINNKNSTIKIKVDNSKVSFLKNLFFRNYSNFLSSAFYIEGDNDEILIERSSFYSNKSNQGSFYLNVKNSSIYLIGNTFINNLAISSNELAKSGFYSYGFNNKIYAINNYFFGNISNKLGSSFSVFQEQGFLKLLYNKFIYNYSRYDNGGSVFIHQDNDSIAEILNNEFSSNVSIKGGALYAVTKNSELLIANNIFNGNHTHNFIDNDENGGALSIDIYGGEFLLLNNTIYNNNTHGKGGGLFLTIDENAFAKIVNNIFWENYIVGQDELAGYDIYANIKEGNMEILNNIYKDTIVEKEELVIEENNMNIDPKFENPSVWDFHLKPDSDCIDAGLLIEDKSLPEEYYKDIDGQDRIIGSSVDIGADEYNSSDINDNKLGKLIINQEIYRNKIATKRESINKTKFNEVSYNLICVDFSIHKEVLSYAWDLNGDNIFDIETEEPYLIINKPINKNLVKCFVKYIDGSIKEIYY